MTRNYRDRNDAPENRDRQSETHDYDRDEPRRDFGPYSREYREYGYEVPRGIPEEYDRNERRNWQETESPAERRRMSGRGSGLYAEPGQDSGVYGHGNFGNFGQETWGGESGGGQFNFGAEYLRNRRPQTDNRYRYDSLSGPSRIPDYERFGAAESMVNHTGRGPKNYKRSDSRIEEDVNEQLTWHHMVDATDIEVSVKDGEVTLRGTVDHRITKRMAENLAESVSGVKDVRNEIKVRRQDENRHDSGKENRRGDKGDKVA